MKQLFQISLRTLSLTLLVASCAGVQNVKLETSEFKVANAARFNVGFFKTKSKGFDVSLSGISLSGKSVVIRKDEISCGRGTTNGVIRGLGKLGNDQFLVLPAETFKEFHVYCGNSEINSAEGNYYVKIKNIYTSNITGQPEKAIAADVRLELK
ncbi:MAG: hypothetical protein K2Q18_16865 [Bdellovibrionales bacterium]|nr:hypothetical protein [Bdellovibrionales bacterium]